VGRRSGPPLRPVTRSRCGFCATANLGRSAGKLITGVAVLARFRNWRPAGSRCIRLRFSLRRRVPASGRGTTSASRRFVGCALGSGKRPARSDDAAHGLLVGGAAVEIGVDSADLRAEGRDDLLGGRGLVDAENLEVVDALAEVVVVLRGALTRSGGGQEGCYPTYLGSPRPGKFRSRTDRMRSGVVNGVQTPHIHRRGWAKPSVRGTFPTAGTGAAALSQFTDPIRP
jgi:hypothetical protein